MHSIDLNIVAINSFSIIGLHLFTLSQIPIKINFYQVKFRFQQWLIFNIIPICTQST